MNRSHQLVRVIGTAVAAASFWASQAILARRGGGFSASDPAYWRASPGRR